MTGQTNPEPKERGQVGTMGTKYKKTANLWKVSTGWICLYYKVQSKLEQQHNPEYRKRWICTCKMQKLFLNNKAGIVIVISGTFSAKTREYFVNDRNCSNCNSRVNSSLQYRCDYIHSLAFIANVIVGCGRKCNDYWINSKNQCASGVCLRYLDHGWSLFYTQVTSPWPKRWPE